MGRLTEAIAFIELHPKDLTGLWKKDNLNSITVTPELMELRRQRLKEKRLKDKRHQRRCD